MSPVIGRAEIASALRRHLGESEVGVVIESRRRKPVSDSHPRLRAVDDHSSSSVRSDTRRLDSKPSAVYRPACTVASISNGPGRLVQREGGMREVGVHGAAELASIELSLDGATILLDRRPRGSHRKRKSLRNAPSERRRSVPLVRAQPLDRLEPAPGVDREISLVEARAATVPFSFGIRRRRREAPTGRTRHRA